MTTPAVKRKIHELVQIGTSFLRGEMGKRGPKPVNMGMLNMWEFEFWKAFHLLRDGVEVPGPRWARLEIARLSPQDCDALAAELRKCTLKDFAGMMEPRQAKEFRALDPLSQQSFFENWRDDLLQELKETKPRLVALRHERRKAWAALVKARTSVHLEKACESWKQIVKERGFPAWRYLLENAGMFFAMKRAPRFPRSTYADDSRIDYLARGMAGVLMNVSSQTAIERLRNMKHGPGGPLWKKEPSGREYCNCWRCKIKGAAKFYEAIGLVDLEKGEKKR